MAESTPEQQQYPNLNPYANQNGNGSLQGAKDSVVNSKVGASKHTSQATQFTTSRGKSSPEAAAFTMMQAGDTKQINFCKLSLHVQLASAGRQTFLYL